MRITAVIASGVDAPVTMARLAEFLELPGVNPEIATLVSNKAHFREWMSLNGFSVPRFKVIDEHNHHLVPQFAQEIGYPLIVKNTDSSGSRGTTILRKPSPATLATAVQAAVGVSRSKTALIESLWEGSEHTVEAIIDCGGKFHQSFITDRLFAFENDHPVETGLVSPSQLPKTKQKQLFEMAEEVARKLGLEFGIIKLDAIFTADGPRIIEMTTRQSGGFDPQVLVPAATGVDILSLTVQVYSGSSLPTGSYSPTSPRVAVSGSPWPNPGRIIEFSGVEKAKASSAVEGIFIRSGVGDTVDDYVDSTKRVAIAICSGMTLTEATDNLADALSSLEIKTTPSPVESI